MRVKTQMTEKLTTAFAPHILTIEDVSHHHAGHTGALKEVKVILSW